MISRLPAIAPTIAGWSLFILCYACWKIIFYNSKKLPTHLLMGSNVIIIIIENAWNIYEKHNYDWLVRLSWCFQPNYCDHHIQYAFACCNFFNKKRLHTYLLINNSDSTITSSVIKYLLWFFTHYFAICNNKTFVIWWKIIFYNSKRLPIH